MQALPGYLQPYVHVLSAVKDFIDPKPFDSHIRVPEDIKINTNEAIVGGCVWAVDFY